MDSYEEDTWQKGFRGSNSLYWDRAVRDDSPDPEWSDWFPPEQENNNVS